MNAEDLVVYARGQAADQHKSYSQSIADSPVNCRSHADAHSSSEYLLPEQGAAHQHAGNF